MYSRAIYFSSLQLVLLPPHAKTFQVTKRVWSIDPSTAFTINKTESITDTIRSTSALKWHNPTYQLYLYNNFFTE